MHEHAKHVCDHKLEYCAKCDVVYCSKCSSEWSRYAWTYYYNTGYTKPWSEGKWTCQHVTSEVKHD